MTVSPETSSLTSRPYHNHHNHQLLLALTSSGFEWISLLTELELHAVHWHVWLLWLGCGWTEVPDSRVPFSVCAFLVEPQQEAIMMAACDRTSAAKRRERRLRSWWRHERIAVAAALAEAHHLSAPKVGAEGSRAAGSSHGRLRGCPRASPLHTVAGGLCRWHRGL